MVIQKQIVLKSYTEGFHLITDEILKHIEPLPEKGILHLFLQHTSAGLTINENSDPAVINDLKNFFKQLVPESYSNYTHILEGLDDMPAHIKSSIFGQSLSIPISKYKLELGTWQGIYLCEFRKKGGQRNILATIIY